MKNFKKLVVLVVLLSACKFNLHAQFYGCMSNDLLALHNVPTAPQLTSDVMVVPVVVHVLHYSSDNVVGVGSNISDAQVLDAIQKLNDAYRNTAGLSTDMEIQFCLAKKDPNGDNTSGIDRIPKNLFPSYPNFVEGAIGTLNASEIQFYNDFNWDSHYYLNIWVSDEIRSRAPNGNLNNPLTFPIYGASIIPSVPNGNTYLLNTTRDGVWIRNDEFGTIGTAYNSSVGWLVHEVGHWLNLIHLEWEEINSKYILHFERIEQDNFLFNELLDLLGQGVFADTYITSRREELDTSGSIARVREDSGVQFKINRVLPYHEFLKRISRQTNLSIQLLHRVLSEYARTNNVQPEKINEHSASNFVKLFQEWKVENLSGRFSYSKANLPVQATALTYGDGTDVIIRNRDYDIDKHRYA